MAGSHSNIDIECIKQCCLTYEMITFIKKKRWETRCNDPPRTLWMSLIVTYNFTDNKLINKDFANNSTKPPLLISLLSVKLDITS